jgi:hypothetical protein
LLRLLPPHHSSGIGGVTYVEVTAPAAVLLKLLKSIQVLNFPLEKIRPRSSAAGPVLNLATVRNEKGEVISLDFYHEVLAIRRGILDQLRKSFANHLFFKGKSPISMISSCFGLRIAQDITPAVCLAYYARWRKNKEETTGKEKNILVLPGPGWSDSLTQALADKVEEVIVEGKTRQAVHLFNQVTKHAAKAVIHRVYLASCKPWRTWRRQTRYTRQETGKGKIMTTFFMGVQKEKRNDLPFYHSSTMTGDRMLLLLQSRNYLPSAEDLQWIRHHGATCLSLVKIKKPGLNIPVWNSSLLLKELLHDFYGLYLKTLGQCVNARNKDSLWMLDKFWEIQVRNIFWQDLFLSNGVKIVVNSIPTDLNFIPNLAISETGGMAVEFERSIRFDYCTYIHNAPNYVYFATGPYSLTQTPEPSFSLFTIQSGGINLIENPEPLEELQELKQHLEIIITVFDELANDIFLGNSVRELYESLIELVRSDPRFFLLIKTKKPQVLESMEDIAAEISRLSREGRCRVLDWKVSPSTAVANGNLVVSVISTAAFESALLGARTIIYYPMRAGSRIFYSNNGLNRRIFEDPRLMISAIKNYANGKNDTLGDCSDIVPQIDPFGDGKGAERVGKYLEWCLEGFDAGIKREKIIENANNKYAEKWGNDKITSANSYEILQADR